MSEATNESTKVEVPTNRLYLADRQVREIKDEIDTIERSVSSPNAKLQDKHSAHKQLRALRADMEKQMAPETTPEQRDQLAKDERELRQKIVEAMPSQEEMRKCPPGAIGKEVRFQKTFKTKIIQWKNTIRMLEAGNDDPDVSNLEKFRPKASTLNMDNAIIQGKQYFIPPDTEQYKANYDRTFNVGTETEKRIEELEKHLEYLLANAEATPVVHDILSAKCGKECKGGFGLRAHERQCKKCKELVASPSVEDVVEGN